jgi:hypothetical protein
VDPWLRALAEAAYAVVWGSAVVGVTLLAGVVLGILVIWRTVARRTER